MQEGGNAPASSSRRKLRTENIGWVAAYKRLLRDYFVKSQVYAPDMVRRRLRMSRQLFERIVEDLVGELEVDPIDERSEENFQVLGSESQLWRDVPRAQLTTLCDLEFYIIRCVRSLGIILSYFAWDLGHYNLRKPTYVDIQKLYTDTVPEAKHGFHCMLSSIDLTSHDLWIWHVYFGVVGSNNNINFLNQSLIFNDVYDGKAPNYPFDVNGVTYKHEYYLANGIYLKLPTFIKAFMCSHDDKRKNLKSAQESVHKDIEQAFVVLKQHWHILHNIQQDWEILYHAGCKLNRKSTSGACQFLGDKLVSWSSRKQTCVSLSTAEAEYVAAACCCSQVLWMKTQLADFGYTMHRIPIYCDSKSAIQITANPVQHSRTKHIDIRYHFIKDHVEKGNIELYFVESDYQLADLFTKPFDEKRHFFLLSKLGMLDLPA
ncbi:hypothetical protein OSB04_000921 [Centaurea solstitialis]|uniref:Uncharacterized protein n=1 Tax=Centaurea solstitialis TaxID=347529 RepID=A0AA38U1T2_9ASTR|nr:hypothetical protein OSB04_000921 [Centaurea solstitialis]